MERIRVIVTGATGMVGEGVLLECLRSPAVEAVLIVNRRPSGFSHPKLREIVHADFFNIHPIASDLKGYDACFFCLGVSSVGMNADAYYRNTYTLTLHVAEQLQRQNPDMVFCYVSGAHTDSTEQGRVRWARVKGKTENDLMKLGFRKVFAFRPGFMKPTAGQKNTLAAYRYIGWFYPIGRTLFPGGFNTLAELGEAMIYSTLHPELPATVEVKDIVARAAAQRAVEA